MARFLGTSNWGLLEPTLEQKEDRIELKQRGLVGNQPIVRGDRDGDVGTRPTLSFLFPFLPLVRLMAFPCLVELVFTFMSS